MQATALRSPSNQRRQWHAITLRLALEDRRIGAAKPSSTCNLHRCEYPHARMWDAYTAHELEHM